MSTAPRLLPSDPRWLRVAWAELGVTEMPGPQHTRRILDYADAVDLRVTSDETPWCSCFVNWVMREAGYARTRSAPAVSWLRYGTEAHDAEQRGAIVVLNRRDAAPDPATGSPTGNHVGFLLEATPQFVTVLGGNQGNAVKVSRFARAAYRVRAVRVPRPVDQRPA